MLIGAQPPPPPLPSLGASLQRQLCEIAPALVSVVTTAGALLGANNLIDNRIEASSKEAAATSKEILVQIVVASKEAAAANKETAMQIAMQIADVSKEAAAANKKTAIAVVVSICIAVIALVIAVIAQRQPSNESVKRD
jgi:hypothetical protein